MKVQTEIKGTVRHSNGFFTAQLEMSKRITGDVNSFVKREPAMSVVPVPPICLQWLINSNGWPLGMATSCTGAPRSFKSSFSHELAFWFVKQGGGVNVIDTKNKQALFAMNNIYDASEQNEIYTNTAQYQMSSVATSAEWKTLLLGCAALREEWFESGDMMPLCALSIIDSIGKDDAEILCKATDQLAEWPVCLHTVYGGSNQPNSPLYKVWGQSMNATGFSSLDLEFSIGGTSAYNASVSNRPKAGKTGWIVGIKVRHSVIGPSGNERKIYVPVIQWCGINPATGRKESKLYFDWGAADAHFLKIKKELVTDTLDINVKGIKGKGDYYWSTTLRVAEDQRLPACAFGLLVQSNSEVMRSHSQ